MQSNWRFSSTSCKQTSLFCFFFLHTTCLFCFISVQHTTTLEDAKDGRDLLQYAIKLAVFFYFLQTNQHVLLHLCAAHNNVRRICYDEMNLKPRNISPVTLLLDNYMAI